MDTDNAVAVSNCNHCGKTVWLARDTGFWTDEQGRDHCDLVRVHEPTFPYTDMELRSIVVKMSDDWVVLVTPMLFNDRVLLATKQEWRYGYSFGWCYDKGLAAVAAAYMWNPDNEDEPMGFKKAAVGNRVRGASVV